MPPDVEVVQESRAVMRGRDPQLERAVQEALGLLQTKAVAVPQPPAQFPVPARRPGAEASSTPP